jgi:predicted CXXCH cytochrome family protein
LNKRIFLLIIPALFLYGCQNADAEARSLIDSTATPTLVPASATASMTLPPPPTKVEDSEEWILWSKGAHARMSGGEQPQVQCTSCHATALDDDTKPFSSVDESSGLCIGCHNDIDQARRQADTTDPIHSGLACTDCHNPHSTAATCSNCHANTRDESIPLLATPQGGHPNLSTGFCPSSNCHPQATQAALSNGTIHGSTHAAVTCTACHDASGLPVSFSMKTGRWITFEPVDASSTPAAILHESHAIQSEVDCTRCHFEDNSWGLPLVTGSEFGISPD